MLKYYYLKRYESVNQINSKFLLKTWLHDELAPIWTFHWILDHTCLFTILIKNQLNVVETDCVVETN